MKKGYRRSPTANAEFRVCQWCGYETNPLTHEFCEVCERPLHPTTNLDRDLLDTLSSKLSLRLLVVSALLLLAGGVSYLFLGNQTPPPNSTAANSPTPSPTLSDPAPPSPIASDPTLPDFVTPSPVSPNLAPSNPATEITSATDIRLYRTFQDVPNVPKGQFSYSSALAFVYLKTYGMNDRIQAAHPEFQLRANDPPQNSPDSTTAIKMLIDGEVNIAQSTRPLETEEVNRARSRQLTLEQIPVAIDGILFYVHPELPIAGLSLNQIQDIYSGKVTNWKEVGGPDVAVVPISPDPKLGSVPQQALGTVAEKMSASVQIIRDQAEGIRRVSSTPGAISFGGGINVVGQKLIHILSIANSNSTQYVSPITPTGEVDKQVLRNGTYPLTRRLYVVIRRNKSPDEQAGVAYANLLLSAEGQKLIESIGLVPLY